jgi:hypothetical protein
MFPAREGVSSYRFTVGIENVEIFESLVLLVRLEGFGPPACGLEVRCSIQLSYRRKNVMY